MAASSGFTLLFSCVTFGPVSSNTNRAMQAHGAAAEKAKFEKLTKETEQTHAQQVRAAIIAAPEMAAAGGTGTVPLLPNLSPLTAGRKGLPIKPQITNKKT